VPFRGDRGAVRAAKALGPVLVAFVIVALLAMLVLFGYMVVHEDYYLFARIFAGVFFVVLLPIFVGVVSAAVLAWYRREQSGHKKGPPQ
jgi:hypothetical protein